MPYAATLDRIAHAGGLARADRAAARCPAAERIAERNRAARLIGSAADLADNRCALRLQGRGR